MKACAVGIAIVFFVLFGGGVAADQVLSVDVDLTVEQHGHDVFAKLTFINRTSRKIPILKSESGFWLGVIDENVFEIRDANGNVLSLQQRGVADIDGDSIYLPPGAMVKSEILLSHFYNFRKDMSPYSIRYVSSRMCDRCGEFNSVDYLSNQVTLVLR